MRLVGGIVKAEFSECGEELPGFEFFLDKADGKLRAKGRGYGLGRGFVFHRIKFKAALISHKYCKNVYKYQINVIKYN